MVKLKHIYGEKIYMSRAGDGGGVAIPHFPRKKGEIKIYMGRKIYINVGYIFFSRVYIIVFVGNWGIGEL